MESVSEADTGMPGAATALSRSLLSYMRKAGGPSEDGYVEFPLEIPRTLPAWSRNTETLLPSGSTVLSSTAVPAEWVEEVIHVPFPSSPSSHMYMGNCVASESGDAAACADMTLPCSPSYPGSAAETALSGWDLP